MICRGGRIRDPAEDLGGPHPRKINYFPKTGKVMVRRLCALQKLTVVRMDTIYETSPDEMEIPGEIELFA